MSRKLTEKQRESIIHGRERYGLSRSELARMAGVSYGAVASIESGKSERSRRGVFDKIRTALEDYAQKPREDAPAEIQNPGGIDASSKAAPAKTAPVETAPTPPGTRPAGRGSTKGVQGGVSAPSSGTAPNDENSPDIVVVTARPHEFHVSVRDQPAKSAVGLSLAEAVGNLVIANQRWFLIELQTGEIKARRKANR